MTAGRLPPEALLQRLRRAIPAAAGAGLLGLYVHGSWVAGDFDPRRSDVDLLAVLAADPGADLVRRLGALHDRLVAEHPEWADRVEVEYVSRDALADRRSGAHRMARISPGEPLHVVPVSEHFVLDWHAARTSGVALHGPPAAELLPDIPDVEWTAAVRATARSWPDWVEDMRGPGGQAYAVLTVCRALVAVEQGRQVSKRAAATWAAEALPHRAELVTWASRWWYAAGAEDEPDRLPAVRELVREVADRIRAAAPGPR